jgi:AraC-like DNA-binding protein
MKLLLRAASLSESDEPKRDRLDVDFRYFDIDDDLVREVLTTENPPHRHEFEEIMLIRAGKAEHLLDGERVVLTAKTLVVVPKGHVHRLMPSAGLEGSVIRFKDEFLAVTSFTVFSQFVGLFHLALSDSDAQVLDAIFSLIKAESTVTNRHRRTTVAHLVQALVSKIEELKLMPLDGHIPALREKQKLWERFNEIVEQHYKRDHSVAFYAHELGISPRKLNEVVRLFLGKSVGVALDERLVVEAKRLILFSGMNIKEIAFDLGFKEHSHFSKVFRRIAGTTPSLFEDLARSAQSYQL